MTEIIFLEVDNAEFPDAEELLSSDNETIVLTADFKVHSTYRFAAVFSDRTDLSLQTDVNAYISGLLKVPTGVKNLADLIQFNIDHADEELIPPFYADQSQSVMYLSFFFVA